GLDILELLEQILFTQASEFGVDGDGAVAVGTVAGGAGSCFVLACSGITCRHGERGNQQRDGKGKTTYKFHHAAYKFHHVCSVLRCASGFRLSGPSQAAGLYSIPSSSLNAILPGY